jgi:hypothetical protein
MKKKQRGSAISMTLPLRTAPYVGAIAATSTHAPHIPMAGPYVPPWRPRNGATKVVPYDARVATDVHVLIASVPWRRRSLNRLLRDVAAQSTLPAYVHLVLDGDGAPACELDISPLNWNGVEVSIRVQKPGRGAGSRWSIVDLIPDDHFVCNLDDDIGLPQNYIAMHRGALEKQDAVCSGGYTPDGHSIFCTRTDTDYEGPLSCLQAGAFSVRAARLRGLATMPMAAELLGVLGDDEALISAHLWKTGVEVRRVNMPVTFDPTAGDPRSQYAAAPRRIVPLRTELSRQTGWKWIAR